MFSITQNSIASIIDTQPKKEYDHKECFADLFITNDLSTLLMYIGMLLLIIKLFVLAGILVLKQGME